METGLKGPVDLPIRSIFADDVKLRPIDEERIQDLMQSFKSKGQQQAIKVRPKSNRSSCYVVVFGEHRLEAARRLGWETIQAVVEQLGDLDALELKITENVQRNHYNNPFEEGRIYQLLLLDKYHNNLNALAESIGKATSYMSDRLTVYHNLDRSLLQFLGKELTTANAVSIAKVQDHKRQLEIAQAVIKTRQEYASTAWGSGGGGGDRPGMGRVKVRPFHACTCGCGDIHPVRNTRIMVDVGEPGVGIKAVLGLTVYQHRGSLRAKQSIHIENPDQEGYSICGYQLASRWQGELPEHVDTRTFKTADGEGLCDNCARTWRKAEVEPTAR